MTMTKFVELMERNVEDYRRAVTNRKAGGIRGDLKKLAGMQPARYRCTIKDCPDVILIAKAHNDTSVAKSIDSVGWAFSSRAQGFVCPEHKYLTRQLDHRRASDGTILR